VPPAPGVSAAAGAAAAHAAAASSFSAPWARPLGGARGESVPGTPRANSQKKAGGTPRAAAAAAANASKKQPGAGAATGPGGVTTGARAGQGLVSHSAESHPAFAANADRPGGPKSISLSVGGLHGCCIQYRPSGA
jgi:hypothetical protein